MDRASIGRTGNSLLRALSDADLDALLPWMSQHAMKRDDDVFKPDEQETHAWFPNTGMISIVAVDGEGGATEVATVGHEGMTGIPILLGGGSLPFTAFVQIAGDCWRIEAGELRRVLEARPSVKARMSKYVLAAIVQLGQNAACGTLHPLDARCARWLLMAHDDVEGDAFELTQEYLALMLGATRPSVSSAASSLQRAGLIRYVRGHVTVLDREGLERASCGCYSVIKGAFQRLQQ